MPRPDSRHEGHRWRNAGRYNREMHYAEILKYLDEKIERLQYARDLLAGMSVSSGGPRKKTRAAARKPSKALKPQAAASTPPVHSAVQVQRLPYRNKTRPQRVRRPPQSSLTSTALTATCPPDLLRCPQMKRRRHDDAKMKLSRARFSLLTETVARKDL